MKYRVSHHKNTVTFSPDYVRARVMMVPFATDASLIEEVLELGENQHHAWGAKEMLAEGIEVTVIKRYKSSLERFGQDWRMPDTRDYDLIYSNHNYLVRTPLEHCLGLRKTPLVSLVYAGESLLLPKSHYGIIGMTPHAHQRFASLAGVQTAYAPWGLDPESKVHEVVETSGDYFISTGVTERDFDVLLAAARRHGEPLTLAARGQTFHQPPANVSIVDKMLGPWDIRELYKGARAGLVILKADDEKRLAVGWTNMIELMAVGLPIIKTRTGSLDDIVDIEKIGAGILIEPGNPEALAAAMTQLSEHPEQRLAMGRAGADYVRSHLTMQRFAQPLIDMVTAVSG
ncbi:MAG: glycosyltransferase [Cellvibrionaceae bacterium]|nr:glycosyltransferase [Cellvibrionaceae bacterium]